MNSCDNCGKKIGDLKECPYCMKHFCQECYETHMDWEKQHQDWSLYQVSPASGVVSHFESRELNIYGSTYQTDVRRRRYRRRRG
ncbi:MAG: hypothetical protein QXN62_05665 [Candidatus Bathyarchaeia archaeon]|nr:hypothetical protein [Candidatus Bathyarchaeota archaeon]